MASRQTSQIGRNLENYAPQGGKSTRYSVHAAAAADGVQMSSPTGGALSSAADQTELLEPTPYRSLAKPWVHVLHLRDTLGSLISGVAKMALNNYIKQTRLISWRDPISSERTAYDLSLRDTLGGLVFGIEKVAFSVMISDCNFHINARLYHERYNCPCGLDTAVRPMF